MEQPPATYCTMYQTAPASCAQGLAAVRCVALWTQKPALLASPPDTLARRIWQVTIPSLFPPRLEWATESVLCPVVGYVYENITQVIVPFERKRHLDKADWSSQGKGSLEVITITEVGAVMNV